MIKRSFFSLTHPVLEYDPLEPSPRDPESIPVPDNLVLLVHEPLKNNRKLLFKKGDRVEKAGRIRLYADSTEYAVCPVSGEISSIDLYADDFGNTSTLLGIKKDRDQRVDDDFSKYAISPDIESADMFLRYLPGAPPVKILADPDIRINTLVVTCTERDLLSTSSQYLSATHTADIKEGLKIIKSMTGIPKICLAIPGSLNIRNEFEHFQTFIISQEYPAALPVMIMKNHLNLVPAPGQTCEDLGVCFISAEAVISISKTFQLKELVFEKLLTLVAKDGSKHRVKATIGTPLRHIFSHFNIHINERDRIIIGGPMKGFATFTEYHPVMPDTDMVLIQDRDSIPALSDTACINCGKCIRICPAGIPVNLLVRYLQANQYEVAADGYDLESCIECGLCAYVCMARIPLFQYIRLGKHELLKLGADT